MCIPKESSGSGFKGATQLGMRGWAPSIPIMQQQPPLPLHQDQQQRSDSGQRRYKFEARLGQGRHQGTLYRARDEWGKLWAVEVVPQPERQSGGEQAKVGPLVEEEEVYTDYKTGARCFVSRLPRESMRQRLSRAGGYGLGTVLRWARQLAAAAVGGSSWGLLGLDSLWVDDMDSICVGDYRPSSLAIPPSSSYGYQAGSEEEGDLEEAEERVVAEGGKQEAAEGGVPPFDQPRVLEAEEVKAFGVLLYQLATKTALSGDTAQAYAHIVARAEARDEASGKKAIMDLLRRSLQQRDGEQDEEEQQQGEARESGGRSGEARRPLSEEELAPLAELIADALMGKPHLARNLLAAIPSPRSASTVLLPPPSFAAEEDNAGPLAALEEQKQQQQQRQQQHADEHAQSHPPQLQQGQPQPVAAASEGKSRAAMPSSSSSLSADDDGDCPAPLRPILGALRQQGDAKLRRRALYGLKKLGHRAAEPAVMLALMAVMLGAQDPVSRRMAAWTLGSLGEPAVIMGAVPALIKALGDAEAGVRGAAAWALGGMGRACEAQGARATLLHRSLKDEDAQVRELAGKSLAHLSACVHAGMKRRRPAEGDEISSSEDGPAATRVEAYYAKRRPVTLASTTRSMAHASIDDTHGNGNGLPPLVPISAAVQLPHQTPPMLLGGPNGVGGFQVVHVPGAGPPVVAVALAPNGSPSPLSSLALSAWSSVASSPTGVAAPSPSPVESMYFVHVPQQGW